MLAAVLRWVLCTSVARSVVGGLEVSVEIEQQQVHRRVSDRFLSVAIDSSIIRRHFCSLDFRKVVPLAHALSPAYLRIGGVEADFLLFQPSSFEEQLWNDSCPIGIRNTPANFSMTGHQFHKLHTLAERSGWRIIFDLNVLLRDAHSNWDSSNARLFLDHLHSHNISLDFELGNEPDSLLQQVNRSLSAAQLARDYFRLRHLLAAYPTFQRSLLIGPSVTNTRKPAARQYLNRFLKKGSAAVDAVTFHSYYLDGRTANLSQFLDARILDNLSTEIKIANRLLAKHRVNRPLWLGESSSAYGGGAANLSDRYAAGFMWLDKLGLCAREGVDVVVRQSFYHGHYALIDADMQPNPDFWLTVLFKRLVGDRVLRIGVGGKGNERRKVSKRIRLYAACSKLSRGRVSVYGFSLLHRRIQLRFVPFRHSTVLQYLLQPRHAGLLSKQVLLNGKQLLRMRRDGKVPDLHALQLQQPVALPPRRLAFFELDVDVQVCR